MEVQIQQLILAKIAQLRRHKKWAQVLGPQVQSLLEATFLLILFSSNTILAELPEWFVLGKPRVFVVFPALLASLVLIVFLAPFTFRRMSDRMSGQEHMNPGLQECERMQEWYFSVRTISKFWKFPFNVTSKDYLWIHSLKLNVNQIIKVIMFDKNILSHQ